MSADRAGFLLNTSHPMLLVPPNSGSISALQRHYIHRWLPQFRTTRARAKGSFPKMLGPEPLTMVSRDGRSWRERW